ncbi:hypothetical protein Aduo_017346 [Ancylostoma duodenale]
MSSFYYLLPVLLVVIQRSLASFPHVEVEEEPAVAVAPQPIAHVPVATAHVAPVVAAASAVAPAPYPYPYPYPHMYPYSVSYAPYHHPRTEVHNVVKAYQKEAGHVSKTAMVSEGGHFAAHMSLHPAGHLGGFGLPIPFRSRKLAKKAHKSFNRKMH